MKKIIEFTGSGHRKKTLLWGAAAAVALLAAAALAACVWAGLSGVWGRGLLASLPEPPEDALMIAVEAEGGGLPLRALDLLAEHAALPTGGTPLGRLLPILAGADRAALVLTERETGIVLCCALQVGGRARKALSSGALPEEWASAFTAPEVIPGARGAFELRAGNLPSPLYVELEGRRAYIAQTPADAEEIRRVRRGEAAGMKRKWSVERRWKGHMLLSDGGVLAAMSGDGAALPVGLEIAWREAGGDDRGGDELKWRAWGLEGRIGGSVMRSLKPHDWSKETPLVPDRPLLSIGLNMPSPGRNLSNLPGWLKFLSGQLVNMGLRDSEAAALMTGPTTFSLGGRTQILWFELPGLVLDAPGRGKLAYRALEAFWSQLFMGAEPRPMEGFTHGGSTELPFSVIAAANEQKMLIALADPAMTRNEEVGALIARETKAIGWLFADLPMIGTSLEEMSSVNTLLSADDDAPPIDGASAGRMREALGKMGRIFVVWDTPTGGRARWYE